MTTAEVIGFLALLIGPGGILPFLQWLRDSGKGHEGKPREPSDYAWLAPIGLIVGVLGFIWAAVTVYFGLDGTLPAGSGSTTTVRVTAGLLGSLAFWASLFAFMSVRKEILHGVWTAGVTGMLTGFGALAAALLMTL